MGEISARAARSVGGRPNEFNRLEQFAKAAPAPAGSSAKIDAARSSIQAAASAQELGDLFEYKLKDPITILKNRSALVPIVQSTIVADKVSVWNERAGLPRPQRALWLNNTSGLTLDGGSFSVLEEETFAGEGLFDPIKPGEKRLVSYATDLALNVRAKSDTDQQRVTRVSIVRGVMTMHNEAIESKTYTFRNEDSSPRTVIVEHPVRSGFELRSDVKPAEITSAWMRFQLHVDPKQTASLTVKEAQPLQTTYQVSNIGEETLAAFIRQKSIDKSIEDALRNVLASKAGVDALDEQKEAREKETQKIFDDQQRLRENMKALKGSAEEKALLQRYTKQLNDQEDRLEKLRKEVEELDARSEKAQGALDKMIEGLAFDVRV